ncbi:MAG: transcriptional regulator [Cyanobacteria bacterium P01_A01_bin.123]
MTLTFDSAVYNDLLVEVTPKVIETEPEYERTLAIVEELTFNQNRTPEQVALHKLLVMLVEAYEIENYPVAQPSPGEILRHIMEASGTRHVDLVGILGSSDVVSDIVDGKREVSETQAQILADFFKTSPSLFSR